MQRHNWQPINYAAINALCLARLDMLLPIWLPGGHRQGDEWCALNPTRADRNIGSFSANMQNGQWADFATHDAGGDPVSLYAYLNDLSQSKAARELSKFWGAAA